ncbi:MAG: hypothetical protein Q9165_005613 [Trypethelium subeluteriae]
MWSCAYNPVHYEFQEPPGTEEPGVPSCLGWNVDFVDPAVVKAKTDQSQIANDGTAELNTDVWDEQPIHLSLDDILDRLDDQQRPIIDPQLPERLAVLDVEKFFPRLGVPPVASGEDAGLTGSSLGSVMDGVITSQASLDAVYQSKLAEDLNTGHKRWEQEVNSAYEKFIDTLHENLLPAIERANIIACALRGLASYHDSNEKFNVAPERFTSVLENLHSLRLIVHESLNYAAEERRQFLAFSNWLKLQVGWQKSESGVDSEEAADQAASIDYARVFKFIESELKHEKLGFFWKPWTEPHTEYIGGPISDFEGVDKTPDEVAKVIEAIRVKEDASTHGELPFTFFCARLEERIKDATGRIGGWQMQMASMPEGLILEDTEKSSVADMRMVYEHANEIDDMVKAVQLPGSIRVWMPRGEVKDVKFFDDEFIMLLFCTSGVSYLLNIPYNKLISGAPLDPSVEFSWDSRRDIQTMLLPGGRARHSKAVLDLRKPNIIERFALHTFPRIEGFIPATLATNGRKNREVVCVLEEDKRRFRIFNGNGVEPGIDSPDANAGRAVRLFCESGSASNPGEEVLHLPVIVENAESSPQAAGAAAYQIRKFLGRDNFSKPHVQYNAIMLIGILTDNPGASFTKNMDKKFVAAVRDLLKDGPDPSVQQILRETLDRLEVDKAYDRNLEPTFAMWRKEKGMGASFAGGRPVPRTLNAPPFDPNAPPSAQAFTGGSSHYARNGGHPRGLPPPVELAGRVEEAKTSAKLLQQLVQSTPADEILSNDLVKEFAERCQSAQRSIQGYINCDNPAPDHDTLQTLIETNEQLSLATSKHQRAVLSARRAGGASTPRGTSPYPPPQNGTSTSTNPTTAPQLPPVTDPDDPTDVSYAAPDRRPTFPTTTSSRARQTNITDPYPVSDRYNAPPGPPPPSSSSLQARLRARDGAAPAPAPAAAAAANNTTTHVSHVSNVSSVRDDDVSSPGAVELPTPATYATEASLNPFGDENSIPHPPFEPMNYGSSSVATPAPPRVGAGGARGLGRGVVERQEGAADGRMMHGGVGRRRNGEEEEEEGGEADDERTDGEHPVKRGMGADESVSSGISPVETRPMAFRY